jgi:hypothetical protein
MLPRSSGRNRNVGDKATLVMDGALAWDGNAPITPPTTDSRLKRSVPMQDELSRTLTKPAASGRAALRDHGIAALGASSKPLASKRWKRVKQFRTPIND